MGLAGLCHRPFGEDCTAQDAGDSGVDLLLQLALPRSGRSTPGSPSSCWALEWTFSASCPAQNSRLAYHGVSEQPLGSGTLCVLASLPQPDLEVRSLRNAARQYPCARPSVLSPRAPRSPARARPHRSRSIPRAMIFPDVRNVPAETMAVYR